MSAQVSARSIFLQKTDDEETKSDGASASDVQRMIDANPVLVMSTSTCPFCIEAKRTLSAHGIKGCFVDMDKEPNYSALRKEMTALAANRTSVPQIWINRKHIGGCDDLKALEAAGDLGLHLKGVSRTTDVADVEQAAHSAEKTSGLPPDAAVTTYPGSDAAYFSLFHSPPSMDNRAVRLSGVLSFLVAVACIVFAERYITEWVVLGLALDFGLRLVGLPSPIGVLSGLPFSTSKPDLAPGPARQFASFCAIFCAGVAWACLLGDSSLGARIMLGMLACATFLQGFVNFCAGCFIFGYLIKFGIASKAAFRMHVNTRSDSEYAWEKNNVRTGKSVSPKPITYPTKGLPPNPTDLRAKPIKEDEKWERFCPIKYCHMSYFMMPMSVLGLALPWAMLSQVEGTSRTVFRTLAWTGDVLQILLVIIYLAKCALHPQKVRKEWVNPVTRNSFALPFINFMLKAWLVTQWKGETQTGDLATVLFWLGSGPLAVMTLITVGSWIAFPCDEEYVNPSWMLMPVGNLVGAVAARPVSEDNVEWGWFLFAIGILLWLALWPTTFRASISNHHSDIRNRNLYGMWIAPPAMAMLAYGSLEELTAFDAVQRLLFHASLAMALVLATCTWPLNFFLEGKFTMSVWAFAFPLDVVAAAAVTVYGYTGSDHMQVIYIVALTAACALNLVNMLSTLTALVGRQIFTPEGKWSPMSFMKLTHEAFREAIPKIEKLAATVKPGVADASSLKDLADAWSSLSFAHDVHSKHEDDVIFPALEAFFPGQTHSVGEEHEEHEKLMSSVQAAMDTLLGSSSDSNDDTARTVLLAELRGNLTRFGKDVLEHLDHEEHSFATPIARKYLPVKTSKELVRKSWDATTNQDMSRFLGWVMSTLRMRSQRTRFLKTWVWAMPERAQQLGLMVYRVVDDVTWVEVARDLPEVVPRGLPGYRRYF
ncbi:unnamed protein product [Scytosiphon promiscuus]